MDADPTRDQVLAGVRDYTQMVHDVFVAFLKTGFDGDKALSLTMTWMELMHDDQFHRREM